MTTKADSLRETHDEGGPPYFDLLWDGDLNELYIPSWLEQSFRAVMMPSLN
jgi:hypothetical protein